MKEIGYGAEYKYAHDSINNFSEMEFMPEEIKGTKLFTTGNNPREEEMKNRLARLWKEKYGY